MNPPSPREEFLAGSREVAPSLVGTIPFGLVAGVAAVAAGLTPLQGIALSFLAFSGIAQMIACQLMAVGSPLAITVAAAAVVSLRLLMYSAALAPHIAHLDRRWRLLIAYMMTDQSFAMTVRRYSEPGERRHRHWHFMGSATTLYVTWQVAVVAGVLAGAGVPASWSLDFVVVLTFIALLVPVVRTRADVAAALVAGVVALASAGLPYRLSLIAGSIAGIAAGLAIERARMRRR
ncbi:MAG TPA: AzlC family ABC transporter permease [Usitatibacter sp.]|nr:AzlC family ABC transporter permease [Usitatibacter sp.]